MDVQAQSVFMELKKKLQIFVLCFIRFLLHYFLKFLNSFFSDSFENSNILTWTRYLFFSVHLSVCLFYIKKFISASVIFFCDIESTNFVRFLLRLRENYNQIYNWLNQLRKKVIMCHNCVFRLKWCVRYTIKHIVLTHKLHCIGIIDLVFDNCCLQEKTSKTCNTAMCDLYQSVFGFDPLPTQRVPLCTNLEYPFLDTDTKNFLKTPLAPIYTNFEEGALEKAQFFNQNFPKKA